VKQKSFPFCVITFNELEGRKRAGISKKKVKFDSSFLAGVWAIIALKITETRPLGRSTVARKEENLRDCGR